LHRRLAKLIPADRLPATFTLDESFENFAPKFAESLLELYPSLSEDIIDPSDPQFVLEGGVDVREQIECIISSLSNKEKDVLLRRFGLQGHRTKTLEEIGNEFYVTRERVRQVEARAIRRLQVGTRFAAFKHLLAHEANTLWDTLSLGSELVLPDDLEQRDRNIDPVQQLAVAVVYGNLGKWVSEASCDGCRALRAIEAPPLVHRRTVLQCRGAARHASGRTHT
jgi:DNA-binding CsgD family transcriptional regulator